MEKLESKTAFTQAHTPTPWRAETKYISAERNGKTGKAILLGEANNYIGEASEANARFIVRAVNAHDELVRWLDCMIGRLAETDNLSATEQTEIDLARAALKLAKGE